MEFFGWISALCFSLCYLPQIVRTWRKETVSDISVWMWVLQGGAYMSGLVYGLALEQAPLVFNYGLGLVYTVVWLGLWFKFRGGSDETKD